MTATQLKYRLKWFLAKLLWTPFTKLTKPDSWRFKQEGTFGAKNLGILQIYVYCKP